MAISVSDNFSTLDSCDVTTGWSSSADAVAPALESTIKKEGTDSIKLGKSGTTESFIWYEKSFSSTDIETHVMVVWLYIADQATLNKINQDDCRLYFYDSSGNWAYWNVPLRDVNNNRYRELKVGWNALRCCMGATSDSGDGNRGDSDYVGGSSATYPDVTDLTKVRIYIATNNSTDTIASGDLLMDYWHYGYNVRVSGGIDGGEADFMDFYNYDVNNALGVMERWGDQIYYLFCRLNINDYFHDYGGKNGESGQLTVFYDTRSTWTAWRNFIYANENASFGQIITEANKTTENGVNFVTLDSRNYHEMIEYGNYYNCSFKGADIYLRNIQRIWNCMGKYAIHTFNGSSFNSINVGGISKPTYKATFDGHKEYLSYIRPYNNMFSQFKNLLCRDNSNGSFLQFHVIDNRHVSNQINTDVVTWKLRWKDSTAGTAYRIYSFRLKVLDEDGNPIDGANIGIRDKDGNIVSRRDSGADLAEDMDYSETSLNVDDGTKFSVDDIIMINNEFIKVDSISGDTLTVTRGLRSASGYTANKAANGKDIYIVGIVTSDSNGEIAEQLLTHGYWEYKSGVEWQYEDDENLLAPFTLKIKRGGYKTYREKFTPDDKIDWTITLEHSPYQEEI